MVRVIKKAVPHDPAFGKKKRYRYEVGSWTFPTRKMAGDFLAKEKRRKK